MTKNTFINRLLKIGVIVRFSRGWYIIPAHHADVLVDRRYICSTFGIELGEGRFRFNTEAVNEALAES